MTKSSGGCWVTDRPVPRSSAPCGRRGGGGGVGGSEALAGAVKEYWRAPWSLPVGTLALRLDPLAAVFLLPLAAVGALCALYGVGYLRRHAHGRPIGGSLAAYNILLLSMALVVAANDIVLLLVARELLTLSSWALVFSDHDAPTVRSAGLQYLVAGHLATIALLLLGLLLATGS